MGLKGVPGVLVVVVVVVVWGGRGGGSQELYEREKAKIDEIDCVQRPALVELSTADMSNPTLARIDCFVIARCPKEIAVGQQTFTFFKSPQNCRIGESSH